MSRVSTVFMQILLWKLCWVDKTWIIFIRWGLSTLIKYSEMNKIQVHEKSKSTANPATDMV